MINLSCMHYQWGIELHTLVRTIINFLSQLLHSHATYWIPFKEIVSTIVQFTCTIKGPSNTLSYSRCLGLWPLLTALLASLHRKLKHYIVLICAIKLLSAFLTAEPVLLYTCWFFLLIYMFIAYTVSLFTLYTRIDYLGLKNLHIVIIDPPGKCQLEPWGYKIWICQSKEWNI